MIIARVFPRKTKASPDDDLAFFAEPGRISRKIDEVHVSTTFTWDLERAKRLADAWAKVAPVRLGGPATGESGGDFIPGRYLKPGYIITSRGCPNRCWFCSVPKREGPLRELPIREGCNVLDDNLLACSESHVRAVFAMLAKQRMGRIQFTGGLEAARLRDWHVDLLRSARPKQVFFAYDTPDDWLPLVDAAARLFDAGFTKASKSVRAYVLVGYPGDTMDKAEARLRATLGLGIAPMAMLWKNDTGDTDPEWRGLQRMWARPAYMKIPDTTTPTPRQSHGNLYESKHSVLPGVRHARRKAANPGGLARLPDVHVGLLPDARARGHADKQARSRTHRSAPQGRGGPEPPW